MVKVAKAAQVDKAAKPAAKLAVKPVVRLDLPKAAKEVKEDLILPTLAKEDSALSLLMVVQLLFSPLPPSSSTATLLSE